MWEFVKNACRYICSLIDWAAYRVLSSVYDLFTEISQLTLYNENIMKVISKRIFLILGIFMLFRIAISLITYIISPDKTKDSKTGGKKLITNIIISLFLLATVNIIFEEAYKIQKKVVETRIVEKIFFGENGNENDVSLSFLLYSAFLSPNEKAVSNCETLFDQFQPISLDCSYNLTNAGLSNKMRVGINHVNNEHDFSNVLSDYELINYDVDGEYFFDYTPIISTICAIIVIIMIISFTLDLAIRIVKLLFLQIISPIPIIANMDPNKGEGIFKKWIKQCTDTYLSLFIRITAINFAVFMIVLIKSNFAEIFAGKSIFVTIILIIGCLMFAKQVPKLIEDLLGIKLDGMMLHPLKKMQDNTLFGKQITGIGMGAVAGTAAGAAGLLTGQGIHRANVLKAVSGGWKGDKFGKNFMNAYGAGKQRHKELQEMNIDGVKRKDVFKENMKETFGVESNVSKVQRLVNQGKSIQSAFDAIKQQMTACDSNDTNVVTHNGQTYNRSAKTISKELDELKKTTVDKQSFREQATATASATQNFNNMTSAQQEKLIQAQMDAMYDAAVTAQKQKIADTEKELEGRINAAVAGIHSGVFSTGVESADKVISEQTIAMNKLKEKSNNLGKSLDKDYKPITADDYDVVNIMKQGKAVGAQAASGKMQDYADVGKYTKKKK